MSLTTLLTGGLTQWTLRRLPVTPERLRTERCNWRATPCDAWPWEVKVNDCSDTAQSMSGFGISRATRWQGQAIEVRS